MGGDDTARDDGVDAGDCLKPPDLHIINRFLGDVVIEASQISARWSISRMWRATATRSSSGSTCRSSQEPGAT